MNADLRQLLKQAAKHGWSCSLRNGGHLKITHTSGAVVTAASTASDYRALKNVRAVFERVSGPLVPKPGPGRCKTARRAPAARRRRAVPLEPLWPKVPAMELALDGYALAHPEAQLADQINELRETG